MEDRSLITIIFLKNTLYYTYIFYGENLDLYSTGFHGLDELPRIRVRAILQEARSIGNTLRYHSFFVIPSNTCKLILVI